MTKHKLNNYTRFALFLMSYHGLECNDTFTVPDENGERVLYKIVTGDTKTSLDILELTEDGWMNASTEVVVRTIQKNIDKVVCTQKRKHKPSPFHVYIDDLPKLKGFGFAKKKNRYEWKASSAKVVVMPSKRLKGEYILEVTNAKNCNAVLILLVDLTRHNLLY